MSSPFRNIAIVGAGAQSSNPYRVTASLGSYILAALQCTQEFNITVISRESSNSAFPASQKVIKVPDTYPEDDLVRAFRGQDVVILNIAVGIQDPSKQLIDAAIKAGVKCIIPSDYGSCIATEKTIALFPLAANGAKVIEYLTSADLKGMTWTAVKCGMLFDYGLNNGFMGYDISTHKATIWDKGTSPFSVSTREQIAKAVVKILHHPNKTANKAIYISSFNTSMNEILFSLEKATASKWEVEHLKTDEMIAEGQKMLSEGNFMGIGNLAKAINFSPGYGADFEGEGVLENEMLGLEKEDLDEVVMRVVNEGNCGFPSET